MNNFNDNDSLCYSTSLTSTEIARDFSEIYGLIPLNSSQFIPKQKNRYNVYNKMVSMFRSIKNKVVGSDIIFYRGISC